MEEKVFILILISMGLIIVGFGLSTYIHFTLETRKKKRIDLFQQEMDELMEMKNRKADQIVKNAIDEIDEYRNNKLQ